MDDTIIITRASRCLSIMNIHGARHAGCRRCKACMGWSWAAACGVQGMGISCGLAHSLLFFDLGRYIFPRQEKINEEIKVWSRHNPGDRTTKNRRALSTALKRWVATEMR